MIHSICISIATDDGIVQFGDNFNIYPVYLSRTLIICLNWLENTIVLDHTVSHFSYASFFQGPHFFKKCWNRTFSMMIDILSL